MTLIPSRNFHNILLDYWRYCWVVFHWMPLTQWLSRLSQNAEFIYLCGLALATKALSSLGKCIFSCQPAIYKNVFYSGEFENYPVSRKLHLKLWGLDLHLLYWKNWTLFFSTEGIWSFDRSKWLEIAFLWLSSPLLGGSGCGLSVARVLQRYCRSLLVCREPQSVKHQLTAWKTPLKATWKSHPESNTLLIKWINDISHENLNFIGVDPTVKVRKGHIVNLKCESVIVHTSFVWAHRNNQYVIF